MWFRRKREAESRLKKAEQAQKQALAKNSTADELVDKVVTAARTMMENERINRLAPVIIEAVGRRRPR